VLAVPDGPDWVGLTRDQLPVDDAIAWATTPGSGAVVTFLGVVREENEDADGVVAITYEAYEEHVVRVLGEVISETRTRFPDIDRVVLLHRIGEVALSQASIVVIVSAPHRAAGCEAARFTIDTVKETVPIWKHEHREQGSNWVATAQPIRPVRV